MPPSLAYLMESMMLRGSLSPQKERAMSVPCNFFTLNMSRRTSAGTGDIRMPLRARSSMCVCMPASLKGFVQALTALFGFSPNNKLICSKPPPLVSTRAKQPMSTMCGATCSNWSRRGTYLPDDCHMSLYNRENFIFLPIMVKLSKLFAYNLSPGGQTPQFKFRQKQQEYQLN